MTVAKRLVATVVALVAGAWLIGCNGTDGSDDDAAIAGRGGSAGDAAPTRRSCAGANGTECQGGDCCASLPVPGGAFQQGDPDAFSATVASFRLDRYEVTVGRFRKFVAAYDAWRATGNPTAGSGQNTSVPRSGWSADWTSSLPANADAIVHDPKMQCDPKFETWSSSENDVLPINCVDWFTAFAFCVWDGQRLPTESEWEYAAAGGDANLTYPWGDAPAPDNTLGTANLAVYDCFGNGDPDCVFADILPVGSRPAGNGRFGQSDLSGSMWEWGLDWFDVYPMAAQNNYANLGSGVARIIRGGDWGSGAATLPAAARYSYGYPTARFVNVGFRCAGNAP